MKNARLKYYLNNQPASAPEDIESTEIIADFSDENIQANISASSWTFANQDAVTIRAWKDSGRIFEGLPFKIEAYNDSNNVVAFNGLLDLTDNYQDNFSDELRVSVNMLEAEGLNIFFDQLGALSFAYLESLGKFTANDYTNCKYVVEKKVNLTEELTNAVIIYLMSKELISQVRIVASSINNFIQHGIGGITGGIAAAAFAIAQVIIEVAYAVSILVIIIQLGKKLMDTLLPPVRTHKTLNFRTAMSKVCTHLGYGFNSSIAELDTMYYLPSNPQLEPATLENFLTANTGTPTGIPASQDAQYICAEFFNLMKQMFNGKFAIVNGVCQFHPKGSPYWVKSATYTLPKVRPKTTTTNAQDLNASKVLSFTYDLNDEYSVDEYTGTTYEVQTTVTGLTNQRANLIRGLDEINMAVCLGARKNSLSSLEKSLQKVGGILDGIINFFGGNSNYGNSITNNRIGVLKQTQNWHAIPKVLRLTGDKLATNYRVVFSAKSLYNNYYAFDSFVLSNFGGQKEIFTDVKIPFGMTDFIALTNNSYFKDSQGRTGKIISIKWNVLSDFATASYWVKNVYTKKLTETYIEP